MNVEGGERVGVGIPPPQPFVKSLKHCLKETFFPDDPLRQFQNQPASTRLLLGLQYFFPLLQWAPRYTLQFFKSDLISGITIASLAIPQGISYAKLASLPPILGLCQFSFLYINLTISIYILTDKTLVKVSFYYSFFFFE